ncbi:MAG: hypothetical protein HYW49_12015 [Deltaproteobacteria bacterium]|nr:hypothetical protein [Deltaproteobacteria bacterium]
MKPIPKSASRARQPDLFGKPSLEFGGKPTRGKRKIARPIAIKRAMHVVMRSSRARGAWSLLNPGNRRIVEDAIRAGERFGVRVYDRANVGNHIHFVLKARTHEAYKAFIRLISGKIAFEVTGAKKGRAMVSRKADGKFWDSIPFSRVLEWGRDFINARIYITKNLFQGEGLELPTPSGLRVFRIRDGTLLC